MHKSVGAFALAIALMILGLALAGDPGPEDILVSLGVVSAWVSGSLFEREVEEDRW